jgi:hypothetical protein
MYKLIEPIYPFGANCEPFTVVTEDQKQWLIETGRANEESFETETEKHKKQSKKNEK